ncbi:uncharacterized protein [Aegilops tauschii subsp. strangulata]|uniref:uncharacterized protein n=1 Tax=Aegilops tauschii subsp. strangulata TaxID=200361 RepID=UPI003CC8963B
MGFVDEYWDVEADGNIKLHVIHTNDKKQMTTSPSSTSATSGSSTTRLCTIFDNLLADPRYTFAGFSISGSKTRLECVNLEVANFVDIQKEWRVPEATKELDSLADVAGMLIDDYYNNMRKKITND